MITIQGGAPGPWTNFAPAVVAETPGGTPPVFVADGYYQQVGKRLDVSLAISVTSAGTGSGRIKITLPNSLTNAHSGYCAFSGIQTNTGLGLSSQVFGTIIFVSLAAAGATPIVTGYGFVISGSVEVA